MENEIGSFYEINIKDKRNHTGKNLEQWLKSTIGMEKIFFVCSGREAIEAAIVDIEKKYEYNRKVCILPQYTCDTVIIPFIKHGWDVHFYPITNELKIDEISFIRLLEKVNPTVLLMHTYFGTDTIVNVRKVIQEWRKDNGLIFIEDMTQSLANCSFCKEADYVVGSLRKWFAIPDGGFVASNTMSGISMKKEKKFFVEKKIEAQTLKYEYLNSKKTLEKNEFLQLNREAEEYLYENDSICEISSFARDILEYIDVENNFIKRRENANYLMKTLIGLKRISLVLDVSDRAPLYFPIYVDERQKLQKILIDNNIFAPILWPIPSEVEENMDGDVKYVFEHLLAIPCDQRYSTEDMERIFRCIKEFEREE